MSTVDRPPSRIAITGLGAVTPHAAGVAESWAAVRRGASAPRLLNEDDLPRLPEAHLVDAPPRWRSWAGAPARCDLAAGVDPVIALAVVAAVEAAAQARLPDAIDPQRIGCLFGASKGGLRSAAAFHPARATDPHAGAVDDQSGEFWEQLAPSGPASVLLRRFGWQGPCIAPVTACSTGLAAIHLGARLIRDGACDAVLAGSSDASLLWPVLASYRRLGVLADPDRPPAEACRPFDRERCGFVIGEGAGCLVLERWELARARGAPILAEWLDGEQRCDPAGLTILPEDPACVVRMIRDLLTRTGLAPAEIDAVSLHGTGTRMNDRYEARAIQTVFGDDWHGLGFALKGGLGHLLGGAGSVETVLSVCALEAQIVPPTVNCDRPGDDCPIPLSGRIAQPRPLRNLLKLSLGFGGHLAAGLLSLPPDAG